MTDAHHGTAYPAQSIAPGAPPPYNPLAIIALVSAFVLPVAGIVCGHIALGQVKRTGEQGYGLALAGTILGWVLSGLILLFVVAWFGFFLSFLAVFGTFAQQVPSGSGLSG